MRSTEKIVKKKVQETKVVNLKKKFYEEGLSGVEMFMREFS